MTVEYVMQLLVNALRGSYEASDPRRVNDWCLIAQGAGVPEELARRAVARLRAENSVSIHFRTLIKLTDAGYKKYFCEQQTVDESSAVDLAYLKYPERFHELCRDLLSAEYPRFQSFDGSGGDEGMDGFESETATLFQFHYPSRGVRKDKVMKYLAQADKHPIKRWVLITSKDPTVRVSRWLDSEKMRYGFETEVWGPARVYRLIARRPEIARRYFSASISVPPSGISVHTQAAEQIVNVVGPTVIKTTRAAVKNAPIPGTVGADPKMKGKLKQLIDRLAEFRSWNSGKSGISHSAYPVIYKNYLHDKGCAVNDTPQTNFLEAQEYFKDKIDKTKLGKINTAKGHPNY